MMTKSIRLEKEKKVGIFAASCKMWLGRNHKFKPFGGYWHSFGSRKIEGFEN